MLVRTTAVAPVAFFFVFRASYIRICYSITIPAGLGFCRKELELVIGRGSLAWFGILSPVPSFLLLACSFLPNRGADRPTAPTYRPTVTVIVVVRCTISSPLPARSTASVSGSRDQASSTRSVGHLFFLCIDLCCFIVGGRRSSIPAVSYPAGTHWGSFIGCLKTRDVP